MHYGRIAEGKVIIVTPVFITIDTELNVGLHKSGYSPSENFKIAIDAETYKGSFGVQYQLGKLQEYGLKATFFVDALCAYAVGEDILKRVVDQILSARQEVQLHLHTEWLPYCPERLLDGRFGRNLADFDVDDQTRLLELGIEALVRAGVTCPIAFRAGNFGANDDTLTALKRVGVRVDSSFNGAIAVDGNKISLPKHLSQPLWHMGVLELPVSVFDDRVWGLRPLQISAVSFGEMKHFLNQSGTVGIPSTIVSHSFELINRNRRMPNPINVLRFEKLCRFLKSHASDLSTTHHSALDSDDLVRVQRGGRFGAIHRTIGRFTEQLVSRAFYEGVSA